MIVKKSIKNSYSKHAKNIQLSDCFLLADLSKADVDQKH